MEIRPWRAGDEILAVAAERHISSDSLTNRFMAGVGGGLPGWYLRHISAGPREIWDAQVAVGEGHLLGWAEFGRAPGALDHADVAVIVADPWQRQGIATALMRALTPRAVEAGVRGLGADVLPSNRAAHAFLASVFGRGLRWRYDSGSVRYELPLSTTVASV
jgi:GNAT superfamily N-acetyltransferase